jgi:hypothetical protein
MDLTIPDPVQTRAGLAEHAFERLLGTLARNADEAEFVEGESLRRSLVLIERLLQRGKELVRGCGVLPYR